MSKLVYMETNLIMAVASSRDEDAEALLKSPPPGITILMPSVCYMEALIAFEGEKKRRKTFVQALDVEINEARRNLYSCDAKSVVNFLENAKIANDRLFNELQDKLVHIFDLIANNVHLIHPETNTIQKSFNQPILTSEKELRDDFILQCILTHAEHNQEKSKIFISSNTKQFNQLRVQNLLQQAGITYFSSTQNFLTWLNYAQNR